MFSMTVNFSWIRKGAMSLMLATLLMGCARADGNDPRDTDNPFGLLVFLHWNDEWNKFHYGKDEDMQKAVEMIKALNVGMVRMDFLWADIEPEEGKFDFKKYDKIMNLFWKNDIKVLGLLNYNAPWAAKEWNAAPDPDLYTKYAVKVVKRYKNKIKYWEIWNEPDDPLYWYPITYDMKAYTQLLKTVYPAMKKADPTCVVVMGGIAKFVPQSLKHIYKNGGKDYFDVVNAHPFQDPRLASALNQLRGTVKSLRKVMEEFGDGDKEIWFTEIGCPGLPPSEVSFGWWFGTSPTEDQQAKWMAKVYKHVFKWKGVKRVFWAFFRDWPGFFESSVNDFGIVRDDFSPKPAYTRYKEIISEYSGKIQKK
jgi:polysaccharide biosynthesis protein PslG